MTAVQLSVVVPCRHDSEVIESRYAALLTALESTRRTFEICYVDDGSADRTRELLGALARADPRVRYTVFSRPFGREAALLAGLRMARGQTVILMDSGVRHPPELVPRMLALHSEGYDQVVAERDRTTHGPLRSALRDAGDRLVRHCMDVDVGDGAGDVRLLSRRAVDGVLALPESNRFSRGIFSWIGFATAGLTYREAAPGGSTDAADPRPPLGRRAVNEGIDGVLSFNSRPLRLAIHIGLGILFAALAYALWTALRVLLNGATVPGFATLLTAIVALGGIQLITLGVIGEYVGRIYHESKRRPHYLLQETDESRRPVPLPQHGPLPAAVPAGARAASRPADEGAGPGGTARQFLSFVLVGCVNTAVYFAVYVTLNRWTPYPVAHVLGYTVSVVGSFLLNSYVTCRTKPTWHAFMRYPISSLAGLVAAGCLLLLAVGRFGMDENAAALLAGVLATPLSFLLARWAITAGRRPPAATEPPEPTATTDTTGDSGPAGPAAPGGPPRRRISPAALLALPPLGLLAAAMWLGRWVRPGADDWCFLPLVREEGVGGLVAKFYLQDNGRIVNAVLTGAYAKFDLAGHQGYALVSGALVLAVLWAVTASVPARDWGLTVPRGMPLLLAATVAALFLLASPNTYKTFYWPASSVSHTLAPVLSCAALVPLLRARSRGGRIVALVAVFLAGAALGTLSEESSVVALVVLAAAALLGRRLLTGRRRAYARAWCLAGIAGTGTGILVLLTSPGSRNRRERYDAEGMTVIAPEVLGESLGAFLEILGTLLTTWQYLGAVAVGALAGLLVRTPPGSRPLPRRHTALLVGSGALVFLVAGYLCTVAAHSVFGTGIVVVTRAWNDFLLLYVVLLVAAGALLGRTAGRYGRRAVPAGALRPAGGAGAAVIAAAAVWVTVCAALALSLAPLGDAMRVRAGQWDRQDRWMRAQAASGARELPYTPTSVGGMGEPFGKHGSWPAGCVAEYYRVDRVTHATRLP